MAAAGVDFDAPDLAARIEQLSQHDLDHLPFGVILLDRAGVVLFYSETESQLSGYGQPIGQNFFEISRNPNIGDLRSRIMAAMETGPVDLEFGWIGGLGEHERELRMRVQSSRQGGIWMFIERD